MGGNRLFHCGNLKIKTNTKLFPRPWERDRVRGLTEREKLEILRSSSTDLLQSNGFSLRMTSSLDKSGKLRHPEQSEGSLADAFGQRFRNKFGMTIKHNKSRHPERSEGSPIEGVSRADCSTPHPSLLPKEKENSCGHAELVSASLPELVRNCPSPREEGVGERVQLKEKINPSLKIVPFRKMLKDNFSQPYGTQSHKVQLRFTCSASVSLGESSGCPVKHLGYLKKCAFTLAEVLITLGIIGVVAAITIPSLVTNYQKHVVETKLAKFNSTMNQAMRLSMVDNGDPDGWLERNHNYSYPETVEFMNTYFLPYIKYIKTDPSPSQNGIRVTLLDGSLFSFSVTQDGGDIVYYVNGKTEINPRNKFQYQFTKKKDIGTNDVNSASYIEPYIFRWNGSVNHLKNGNTWACKKGCTNCGYCTKLIQLNGWKIPKDYPW